MTHALTSTKLKVGLSLNIKGLYFTSCEERIPLLPIGHESQKRNIFEEDDKNVDKFNSLRDGTVMISKTE